MDKENQKKSEKEPPSEKKKKAKKLDKELKQTFPASDPPSYSRPGHDEKENKKNKEDKD